MNASTLSMPSTNAPYPVATHMSLIHEQKLLIRARTWEAYAGIVANLAPRDGIAAQRARLHISFGQLPQPSFSWGARFWEEDTERGAVPIEWLLACDTPIECLEDALRLLGACPDLVITFGCA